MAELSGDEMKAIMELDYKNQFAMLQKWKHERQIEYLKEFYIACIIASQNKTITDKHQLQIIINKIGESVYHRFKEEDHIVINAINEEDENNCGGLEFVDMMKIADNVLEHHRSLSRRALYFYENYSEKLISAVDNFVRFAILNKYEPCGKLPLLEWKWTL
jgi:hypothetical protein